MPLTVRFTAAVQGLAIDCWTWTVDGAAAAGNGSVFTHTFLEPGTHAVGLTAVNESASVTNTSSVDINVTAAPAPPAVVRADGDGSGHPRDWYVSKTDIGNVTSLLDIIGLGAGDTIHIWGVEGHTYEGGIVIDKPNVTVKRWEGSPVQPLITAPAFTAPAFTVIADNDTFCGLKISENQLNGDGAGIHANGTWGRQVQSLTITDCTFAGNAAKGTYTSGGALYALWVDNLSVEGTVFTNNTAVRGGGGGARFEECNAATLTGTTFSGNTAGTDSGGLCFWSSPDPSVANATFTDNRARQYGGGEPSSAVSTPAMTPAAPAQTVETLTTPAGEDPTPSATPAPFPTMMLVVGGAIAVLIVAVAVWRTR